MLHICKLSVGIRDVAQLRARQASGPVPCHQTRNRPRRAEEVTAGGSIYWVIAGVMQVRQRILEIRDDHWDDGSACAALILDPALVLVHPRATRPFQGWRYLQPAAAPPDMADITDVPGVAELPETLRRDLRSLCLL